MPRLSRYIAEEDAAFESWRQQETSAILEEYHRKRMELIAWLDNLSRLEYRRSGIHPVMGRLELQEWIHFFLLHENHHLYAIFRLRHNNQPQ